MFRRFLTLLEFSDAVVVRKRNLERYRRSLRRGLDGPYDTRYLRYTGESKKAATKRAHEGLLWLARDLGHDIAAIKQEAVNRYGQEVDQKFACSVDVAFYDLYDK